MKTLIISDSVQFIKKIKDILKLMNPPPEEIFSSTLKMGRKNLLQMLPKLVILDIDSGKDMDMAEYIVKLAPKYSVPIVACTAKSGMKYSMVSAGAVDVITLHNTDDGEQRFKNRLLTSLESITKAVKENRIRSLDASAKLIAIGGSTGSTMALPVILKGLKSDCPPVVCVLHMPQGYTKIYAQQLNGELDFDVFEAKSGMYIRQRQVIIAAGSRHLRVFKDKKGYFITSEMGVKVSGHCPSVDVLFDSCAYAAKSNAIGVILTGMGRDGAKGMLNMKKRGAYNIAQDEYSSVVYGMPKAAKECEGISVEKPLNEIAGEINRRLEMKL